jgi:hypothetical protein
MKPGTSHREERGVRVIENGVLRRILDIRERK